MTSVGSYDMIGVIGLQTISPLREFSCGRNGFHFDGRDIAMKVKICGIRTPEAAKAAEAGGADFIGFIFFSGSSRYIEPEQAKKIAGEITGPKKVGVFVDESPGRVNAIARLVGLDYVQLHGHEDISYAAAMERPIIKAWRFGDGFSAGLANAYPSEIVLLDSFAKGQMGGTGQTFAWREAADEAGQVTKPLLIAGGISIRNVKEAAEIFRPFGVDVSGSLEEDGQKSPRRIGEFLCYVKNLFRI